MTGEVIILYSIANAVVLLLFWLYQQDIKRKESDKGGGIKNTGNIYRKHINRRSSLLVMLGLTSRRSSTFQATDDVFHHFSEVSKACKQAGLEKCGLIIGVDFTASNELQGRKTFSGNCLHKIIPGKVYNPYQRVISVIGRTLEPFDEDNMIPAYGFGDSVTRGESVFPFLKDESPCRGFKQVLERYSYFASNAILSGPTNFAPLIYTAIGIVKEKKGYHILVIIADGRVNEEESTIDAIVEASKYPLSIIVIGVGDGPWDLMEEFDDQLPKREFDNFNFVNFHEVTSRARDPDSNLALHTLMEIPAQYRSIKALGYINELNVAKEERPEVEQRPVFTLK